MKPFLSSFRVPSLLLAAVLIAVATTRTAFARVSLQDLDNYRLYPRRTEEEAAVLEWGNSAVISALDASVALFGPQTSQAALLEVEAMPILASPINGVVEIDVDDDDGEKDPTEKVEEGEAPEATTEEDGEERSFEEGEPDEEEANQGGDASDETPAKEDESSSETTTKKKKKKKKKKLVLQPLANAEEVHGNMVVMTNMGNKLSGVQMAKIAQDSGAAALLVVNVDEERPEDIYRLPAINDDENGITVDDIQIPVVMISLNSANVLTTATVTPEMKRQDIINNGMPERVRLYAGGDRPFFEDVEMVNPTVYLIHNLLTADECDSLIQQASSKVSPLTENDNLQHSPDVSLFHNVQRVKLWQGLLHSPARKAVEERIEQVTGFPTNHFSDFVVDRLEKGSYWNPHYDSLSPPGSRSPLVPTASITIFLTADEHGDGTDGSIVYPSPQSGEPIKVTPRKGLAVVHHNTDEKHQFDAKSIHALLPAAGTMWVARKYVFSQPLGHARRLALPVYALPFGGKLPQVLVQLHNQLEDMLGEEQGSWIFDKLCVFVPMLIVLSLVQYAVEYAHKQMKAASTTASAKTPASSSPAKSTRGKKKKQP